MDLKNMRTDYKKSTIDFDNLDDNPITFFLKWFDDVSRINQDEANACVLSTVSSDNKPSSRVVLLKSINDKGFTFFTNYKSDKSVDINCNKHVALNFYWPELERQVRITGRAYKIGSKDSDEYFKSRPRKSQMAAWLSNQSSFIKLEYDFSELLNELEQRFEGKKISRPLHWGGFNVIAENIEFWQGRPSRFHDRLLYTFKGDGWNKKRLAP